jgi:endogenous inhibitor of DNA gyrase (YacG/DUF329 family)
MDDMTEAEYLDGWGDVCPHTLRHELIDLLRSREVHQAVHSVNPVDQRVALLKSLEEAMREAKDTKAGDMVSCPNCGTETRKTTYHKVFCSNRKTNNTTDMNETLNDALETVLDLARNHAITEDEFESTNYIEDFFVNHVFDDDDGEETEFKFTLYWLDGKREVITSPVNDIARAMTLAGYSNGVVRALDFYTSGDDDNYFWNHLNRKWFKIAT